MSNVSRSHVEREERRAAIEAIGLDVKALVQDEITDQVSSAEDEEATKQAYEKVLQAFADGKLPGTEDEVFQDAKDILES